MNFWREFLHIFEGSSDPSHFIFEINVGKRRIRHRTTLNLNDVIFNRFWVDLVIHYSIWESFLVGSDSFQLWFKKKVVWVWTILNRQHYFHLYHKDDIIWYIIYMISKFFSVKWIGCIDSSSMISRVMILYRLVIVQVKMIYCKTAFYCNSFQCHIGCFYQNLSR